MFGGSRLCPSSAKELLGNGKRLARLKQCLTGLPCNPARMIRLRG